MSPSLVQGYVSAAMKISRRAVGDRTADAGAGDLQPARRSGAGSSHRRPAARHARRDADHAHVPARRGVRVQRGRRLRRRPRRRRRPDLDFTLDGEKHRGGEPAQLPDQGDRRSAHHRRRARRSPARRGRRRPVLGLPHRLGVHARAAACRTVAITGPFNATGAGDTPSRRRILICHPASASEERRARARSSRRWRTAPIAARCSTTKSRRCSGSISRAAATAISNPASSRRSRASWSRPASCSASKRSPKASAPASLPHQRSRAGVAPVVLPVEQHSRRRAAGCREQGAAARSGGARPAGEADARRSRGRKR